MEPYKFHLGEVKKCRGSKIYTYHVNIIKSKFLYTFLEKVKLLKYRSPPRPLPPPPLYTIAELRFSCRRGENMLEGQNIYIWNALKKLKMLWGPSTLFLHIDMDRFREKRWKRMVFFESNLSLLIPISLRSCNRDWIKSCYSHAKHEKQCENRRICHFFFLLGWGGLVAATLRVCIE